MRSLSVLFICLMLSGCLEDKLSVGQEGKPCRNTGDESKKCDAGLACHPEKQICCVRGPGRDCPCWGDEDCETGRACNTVTRTCCRPEIDSDCPCHRDEQCPGGKSCHPQANICCQPGIDCCWRNDQCEDGIGCTSDTCENGQCRNTDNCPDDGNACNGVESCDLQTGGCKSSGTPPPAAPTLIAPANGDYTGSNLRPEFRWSWRDDNNCGAAKFNIQLAKYDKDSCSNVSSCDFSSISLDQTVGTMDYTPLRDLTANATSPVGELFFWRVRTCWENEPTNCSAWSPVRYLKVGRQTCDFNGDGYSDVIIGAPSSETFYGKSKYYPTAAVFYGSAAGLVTDPQSSLKPLLIEPPSDFNNPEKNSRFGEAAACAGDVNGDGFGDAVVAQPGISNVFIYLGSSEGLVQYPVVISPIDHEKGFFGSSAACATDLNGDGREEIIIGDTGSVSKGRNTPPFTAIATFSDGLNYRLSYIPNPESQHPTNDFGKVVAAVGDLDGDGFSEIAIAAPAARHSAETPEGYGRVFVYKITFTASDEFIAEQKSVFEGNADECMAFGTSVGSGDVTGDGKIDLLVGAPRYTWDVGDYKGAVFLYPGPDFPQTPATLLDSGCDKALFGMSVAYGRGSGWPLAVGGPLHGRDENNFCLTGNQTGAVTLFQKGNLQNNKILRFPKTPLPSENNVYFGWAVASPGGIKGSGSDLAVGAPRLDTDYDACPDKVCQDEGRVFVYYDNDEANPVELALPSQDPNQRNGALFGYSIGRQ